MIAWIFPILAVGGISSAYALRIFLSGSNLNSIRLCLGIAFNALFVVPYIEIIQNNNFPYLGYRPDIISDYPFVGWIAFFCIFLHSFACPVKWKVKCWLSKS